MVSRIKNSITGAGKTLVHHCVRLASVFWALSCVALHDQRHMFSLVTKSPVAVAICYSNVFFVAW